MEKLIELLTEYLVKEWNDVHDLKHVNHTFQNKDALFSDELICSRRFWFIERLIKSNELEEKEIVIGAEWDYKFPEVFNFTEQVIMSLSISSSPIDDLIELLK